MIIVFESQKLEKYPDYKLLKIYTHLKLYIYNIIKQYTCQ